MSRFILSLCCTLFLAACVSVPQPLSPDVAERIKKGKSLSFFLDEAEQIHYTSDVYMVLAVAKVATDTTYKGIWNSSKELSTLHAQELSKIGVRTKSLYDVITDAEFSAFMLGQQALTNRSEKQVKSDNDAQPMVSRLPSLSSLRLQPQFRQLLTNEGFDYLFWFTIPSGFSLDIKTLGFPAQEHFYTHCQVYDLRENVVIWSGSIRSFDTTRMNGKTGKEFLESDSLAGLKSEFTRLIKASYAPTKTLQGKGIGQMLGLTN